MTFETYAAANAHREAREAEIGAMKFRSTAEYRELHVELTRLWADEKRTAPKRRSKNTKRISGSVNLLAHSLHNA